MIRNPLLKSLKYISIKVAVIAGNMDLAEIIENFKLDDVGE